MLNRTSKFCFLNFALFASFLANGSSDITLKLKGGFDFQAGYIKSNASKKAKPLSTNHKNSAFSTSAYMSIDASNSLDSGFLYGAKIAVTPTTYSSRKVRSGIYTESLFGRLELGSDQSATSKMRISPLTIASGTGGLWDVWVKGDPVGDIPYIVNYSNFIDSKMRLPGKTEFARKITYYTPEYNGIQLGVSYIPDSSNVGYDNLNSADKHTPLFSNYTYSLKNAVGAGATYKKDFAENFYSKISVVAETAKAIANCKKNVLAPDVKVRKLKTYHFGAEVTKNQYSFAASYANHLKSFTSLEDERPDTSIYGLGARYKFDKASASLTYFRSAHRANKITAITAAIDYIAAPGLMPYAEITCFNANGSDVQNPSLTSKHKGQLFLVGTKVEF